MALPDTSPETIAFIFARGGSKGVPGKNIRPLAGKPLIAWAIEQAKAVPRIGRVIVSTDDEAIAAVARRYGAETPFMRPADLAQDDSPEWLAWRHALGFVRDTHGKYPKTMVSVPTTAPLRKPVDIENCLDAFDKADADVVITATEARRSPYFNMIKREADGTVGLVIPPSERFERRQDVPPVYDVATVAYVCDPSFVMTRDGIFEGRVRAVLVPPERALDIDTLFDFQIAECLIEKGMADGQRQGAQ